MFFSFAPVPFSINNVTGNSMEPTIPNNSLVLLEKYNNQDLDELDIIVYKNKYTNKYIIHRIIEIKDGGSYILQGDNNLNPDIYRPTKEDIKYIYKTHIPPYIYLTALGGYIIMIIYDILRKLFK